MRLPSPVELARSKTVRWTKIRVSLYGQRVRVWYKTCTALWYNSAGIRPLRVVVVRDPSGRRKDDCFFSTDLSLSAKAILQLFAMHWPLEVAFYNAKDDILGECPDLIAGGGPVPQAAFSAAGLGSRDSAWAHVPQSSGLYGSTGLGGNGLLLGGPNRFVQ